MSEFLKELNLGQLIPYSFSCLIFIKSLLSTGEAALDEQARSLTLYSREEGRLWTLITGMINVIF